MWIWTEHYEKYSTAVSLEPHIILNMHTLLFCSFDFVLFFFLTLLSFCIFISYFKFLCCWFGVVAFLSFSFVLCVCVSRCWLHRKKSWNCCWIEGEYVQHFLFQWHFIFENIFCIQFTVMVWEWGTFTDAKIDQSSSN